jgi:hypothetical protein
MMTNLIYMLQTLQKADKNGTKDSNKCSRNMLTCITGDLRDVNGQVYVSLKSSS